MSVEESGTVTTFRGLEPTIACRVCGGRPTADRVESGEGPYETGWFLCGDCGSWSIDREPVPALLDAFYESYRRHLGLSSVNPGANDGRRYTPEWRETREREYRLGMADVGLELRPGQGVCDFGAQDGVFLDVCRSLEPALRSTTAVDYDVGNLESLEARGHRYERISAWVEGTGALDVVTLWDVYEHVADLPGLMGALERRVASGGQVLVQTPRGSLHAKILGPLWHHFLPVQHLQLPSREGLVAQFGSAGFDVAKAVSFGANAPPQIVPQPYKRLFDSIAKAADLGSTQIVRFVRR